MKWVRPTVKIIAETRLCLQSACEWLEELGVSPGGITHNVRTIESDAENVAALAAKRCYKSFEAGLNPNVQKVRDDWGKYFENILSVGHGSVLEHSWFTVAMENVSRVFTAEMNRHGDGTAISEQSLRYVRFTDIPVTEVPSLQMGDKDGKVFDLRSETAATREVFERVFSAVEDGYRELQAIWHEALAPSSMFANKKAITSMMRRIVPMGVATGGVWSMNLRAARHILTMRAAPEAEEEMVQVFSELGKLMVERLPLVMCDFELVQGQYWVPKYRKV